MTKTFVRGSICSVLAALCIPFMGCGGDDGGGGGKALCDVGEINCDGECVLTVSSAKHCGACGNACDVPTDGNAICTDGECGIECDTGFSDCSGTCIDTRSDAENCGGCGEACADPGAGMVACEDGACVVECDGGFTQCDGACVNLLGDTENCGACGDACGANEVCANGSCILACPQGETRCGDACVDTSSDVDNCGACGSECQGSGGTVTCEMGACMTSCSSGMLCGGECVDTDTDSMNCGGCGNVCDSTNGTASCSGGSCQIACDTDFDDCDSDVSNGCETDTSSDLAHCGGCSSPCTSGQFCSSGVCGNTCPLTECGSLCVDTTKSIDHCGGCNAACTGPITGGGTGSPTCSSSNCGVSCGGALTECSTPDGDACVDTNADPQACGACDTKCGAGQKCDAGSCEADPCSPGLSNCGAFGNCINRQTNPSNCGTCGNTCTLGSSKCDAGKCVSSCAEGLSECSVGVGIACVDTDSDPQHCGSCNTKCDAGETCTGGACVEFIYASDCWACGNGNAFGKCCSLGDDTICVESSVACP